MENDVWHDGLEEALEHFFLDSEPEERNVAEEMILVTVV